MPTKQPATTAQPGEREPVCLGILPSPREVGIAIASRERLYWNMVLNLKKIPSPLGKEVRFAQVIGSLIEDYPVSKIAIAHLPRGKLSNPVLKTQFQRIEEEVRRHNLKLSVYSSQNIREKFSQSKHKTSNKVVAQMLSDRYPELWHKVPGALPRTAADGKRLEKSTNSLRERYWMRMFLALGAAVVYLDEEIRK